MPSFKPRSLTLFTTLLALSLARCSGDGGPGPNPSDDAGLPGEDSGAPGDAAPDGSALDGATADGSAIDAGLPSTCSSSAIDGDETDIDCGGSCAPCTATHTCLVGQDCESHVCRGHTCQVATCFDGVQNAGETDVDCGGGCGVCVRADAPTMGADLAASTRFLYEGPGAVQVGVQPGTIEPRRAGVVFGTVHTRDGAPLEGVEVTVLGHPEYGRTNSRAEGRYDLVVNGGGVLVLSYTKQGYLPAQRSVDVPWRDFRGADDVALVALDSAVTTVDFSEPIQAARATQVVDGAGARQATMMFRQGTTATMHLPDGTTQVLPSISTRATEYTVGPNGPAAMPAPLPATSGYTYAVELSVDEAMAAGATSVQFDKPVSLYVENFLEFPVGSAVPAGCYDRQAGAWMPSDDGLVVSVLSVTNGVAALDIEGNGRPASASALQRLEVNHDELVALGGLYAPGTTLMRAAVRHFSPWDLNWPYGPPDDAVPPEPEQDDEEADDDPCEVGGSIVDCQNLTLGESLPIDGTPYSLHYRSDRVPGRVSADGVGIRVTKETMPASLRQAIVEVSVAGKKFHYELPAIADQVFPFFWDGIDAYGRPVGGRVPATLRIGYVYPCQYKDPATLEKSFGALGGTYFDEQWSENLVPGVETDRTRREMTVWRENHILVHGPDARALALGGWTISAHHAYDPNTLTLYGGDGTTRQAASVMWSVKTVPGGEAWNRGGGHFPNDVVVGPDGAIYVAEDPPMVRKITPDGQVTVVAGTGEVGDGGDGGPAIAAQLMSANGIALGPDGSLYIAQGGGWRGESPRVRRVRPDGVIEAFAGNGTRGSGGDDGPARDAQLSAPLALGVGPDGTVYIGDGDTGDPIRIRKVAPDGVISTIAGTTYGNGGDGGPASAAEFTPFGSIEVEADGSLLLATGAVEGGTVRRITPDGIIHLVAGGPGSFVSGVPATQAGSVAPYHASQDEDGRVYIASQSGLLLVDLDGYITRVSNYGDDAGENVPLATYGTRSNTSFGALTFGPDGNLYFVSDHRQIKMVSLSLPGFTKGEIAIPSEDGGELYVFDTRGRHRRTLDSFTGAVRLRFGYDADGRLVRVTDRDGNVTQVERDGSGTPTAIVAPGGQRTALALTADGMLSSIADPAGRTTSLDYAAGGLLTSLTDPGRGVHHFTYDSTGRLARDEGPDGHWKTLSRSHALGATVVTLTTSGGRTTTFTTERLHDGTFRKTRLDPGGLSTVTDMKIDGTTRTTKPDGTAITELMKADPRFGMNAPYAARRTVTTPGGRSFVTEKARTIMPDPPRSPIDFDRFEETTTKNGGVAEHLVFNPIEKTFTRSSPEQRTEVTRLDDRGHTVARQTEGFEPRFFSYDATGLLTTSTRGTGATQRTTSFTYDGARRTTAMTSADGRVTRLAYPDASDRVGQVTLPGAQSLGYGYDADGNVTSVSVPSAATHDFGFTPPRLLISYSPPLAGPNADLVTYRYGSDRELLQTNLPDARSAVYAYDAAGRLTAITLARGTIAYTYGASGLVAALDAPGQHLAFDYDGQLTTRTSFSGAVSGQVDLTYDDQLRPATQSVSGMPPVAYGYDGDSEVTSAGALTIQRGGAHGRPATTTLGRVASGYTYDPFGDLVDLSVQAGSTSLASWQYTWDPAGRLLSVNESLEGEAGALLEYERDAAGRLTAVRKDGGVVESYTYDANGNRTRITRAGSSPESATYDAQDRQLTQGDATYTFSRSGQLTSRTEGGQTTTYTYDELGNLIQVVLPGASPTTIDYVVDGLSRRVAKRVNGAFTAGFIYQGLAPVAQVDEHGVIVARFVYGLSATVPDYMEKGGQRFKIVTDRVGSVRLVVEEMTGAVVQRIEYSPWGEVLSDSSPGFQPFGFAGGLYDADTHFVRFWARDYDPRAGRWTMRDPLRFDGGSVNLFTYVGNDPVSFRDPDGLFGPLAVGIAVGIGALLGTIAGLGKEAATSAQNQTDGLPGGHNGYGDAIRHCTWSCTMANQMGSAAAWINGTGWEVLGWLHDEPADERAMDLDNNECGRSLGKGLDAQGKGPEGCKDACDQAFGRGGLATIK